MKYKELIGKKINVEFNGTVINSYKITTILPTLESMEERGRIYKCSVNWDNKDIKGAHPVLEFDAQTLNDLVENNSAVCPFMPTLFYNLEPLCSS